jgi:hypothetical protein
MKPAFRWTVLRRLLVGGVVALAGLQLVPVGRTNPPVESEVPAPTNVRNALRRACYDCHSNETVWPWYSHVAPLSFWIARDVKVGRGELNFSAWNRIETRQQVKKLKESWEEISEGEMPPWFYAGMHRDAALSNEDRTALQAWGLGGSPTASSVEPEGVVEAATEEEETED